MCVYAWCCDAMTVLVGGVGSAARALALVDRSIQLIEEKKARAQVCPACEDCVSLYDELSCMLLSQCSFMLERLFSCLLQLQSVHSNSRAALQPVTATAQGKDCLMVLVVTALLYITPDHLALLD